MKAIHAAASRPRGSSRRAETTCRGVMSSAIEVGLRPGTPMLARSRRSGSHLRVRRGEPPVLNLRSRQLSHMRQIGPLSPIVDTLDDRADSIGPKVSGLYSVLGLVNLLAWLGAFASFHNHPLLLANCLIAYGFGLRHAVDADHIAAIDNVTRKLMQEGKSQSVFTSRSATPPWCLPPLWGLP